MRPYNIEKFNEITKSLTVLYRASAEHKRLLVQGLMYNGINIDELS